MNKPTGVRSAPALREVEPIVTAGLRITLADGIQVGNHGVRGYLFLISTDDGVEVGTVSALITDDLQAVARSGHIGIELKPEFRRRGLSEPITRAMLPLFREHGLRELLFTCAVGHETYVQGCRALGAQYLDRLPAEPPDGRELERFLYRL